MSKKKTLLFSFIPFIYLLLLLFQKDLAMLGDLGRHLKLGEVIVTCHCVPQTNLFSYTNPNFPIVNHEWLSEVIFYLTTVVFGLNGLLVLKMIIIVATSVLLYFVALKKGSLFWVTIFSLLCLTVFSTRFFVLPELFSYLFLSLFIFLIEKYKTSRKSNLLWFLPALEVLWVNMHIYFIIGIGMYGLFLLEEWLRHKKLDKQFFLVGASLIIGIFCNPSFAKGALLPFTIFHNYGLSVEENFSPFDVFNNLNTTSTVAYTLVLQVVVFEILVGLFLIGFFVIKQWGNIFSLGNGLFAMILGLKLVRCVSLFAVLGFVPLVQAFTLLEEKLQKSMDSSFANIVKGTVAICVGIIVLIHIKGLFDYQLLHFSFVPYAEKSVAFMKAAHVRGPIFNNYRIGNYLIYGLYPQEKIFVDARPEAYPPGFFDEYWRMLSDSQFFNQQVAKYHINAVVFNVDDDPSKIRPFLIRLLQGKEWVPVYGDGLVTIFVRNNKVNREVIEQYRMTLH